MNNYKPSIEIQNKYGILDPEEFKQSTTKSSCSGGCCGSHSGESSSGCCGGSSHSTGGCCSKKPKFDVSKLNEKELQIIDMLKMHFNLPIVEFVLKSTKESDFESICLSPVFIFSQDDDFDNVKDTAKALKNLENNEFIVINIDEPLQNCSYEEYENSKVLAYFKETVRLGSEYENFLGDIASVEKGFISLNYDYLITIDEGYESK